MTTQPSGWQTPAELAAELRPEAAPVTRTRWVKRLMNSGQIPSVKVGNRRYFTPECRRQMEAEQLHTAESDSGWGHITRATPRVGNAPGVPTPHPRAG